MNLQIATPAGVVTTTPLVVTDHLSAPVAIPGTALLVTVGDDAPEGTAWSLIAQAVPAADLGDLLAQLQALDAPVLIQLFGAAPQEPYLTWRNLWESNEPMPYRLGALLLAVAQRTAEARQTGGA